MKLWRIENGPGLKNLALREAERPAPGPGEALVRMRAASLNFRDTMVANGIYGGEQVWPLTPLSDGAGTVEAVGPGVTRFAPGDRVTPCFHQTWEAGEPDYPRLSHSLGAGGVQGVAAEYQVFREGGLVATPEHLSDVEAAAFPCAGVTAWSALTGDLPAKPGDTVLFQGTGGVSVFALQFAHAMGMRSIVTSSSDDKLARARALGADETINYKTTPKWAKAALDLTGGRGVDHIIEVGGAGTMDQSLKAVRIGGRIAVIGVLSGAQSEVMIPMMLLKHIRMQGITVGSRDEHEQMNRFAAHRRMTPVIDDTVFGFDSLPDAYGHMLSRRHFGKICIDFSR